MATTSMTYQGRTFTITPTADPDAPFKLTGARGATLALVPHAHRSGLYFVRTASGNLNAGMVGQLDTGELIHLPASGPLAPGAQARYRAARRAR